MVVFRCHYKTTIRSQNNLRVPVLQHVAHLLQPLHVLKIYRNSLPIYSVCHPYYTIACLYLHKFQVHIFLTRHLSRHHSISCPSHDLERTISKRFTRLIGLSHLKISPAATDQNKAARCFSRISVFNRGI